MHFAIGNPATYHVFWFRPEALRPHSFEWFALCVTFFLIKLIILGSFSHTDISNVRMSPTNNTRTTYVLSYLCDKLSNIGVMNCQES